LLDKKLNKIGYIFKDYFSDPDLMWKAQLEYQEYIKLNIPQDREMGLPGAWEGIGPEFQTITEPAWLGCEIRYSGGEPDTIPIFREGKEQLYETEIPDPLSGNLMERAYEFYEYFKEKREHVEFEGSPIGKIRAPLETMGPFTLAGKLRGERELMLDLYRNPEYVHELMDFVTRAIIMRLKTWMDLVSMEYPMQNPMQTWGSVDGYYPFADDCIELISDKMYKEFVLPYHQRLVKAFSKEGAEIGIHLCGKASHHFKTLKEELNVKAFETGFPTDLARARDELGPEVFLKGNIHPELLHSGPKEKLVKAVRQLLESGVKEGGKFILAEGHNVAPGTPVEYFQAMYETGREYGRLI